MHLKLKIKNRRLRLVQECPLNSRVNVRCLWKKFNAAPLQVVLTKSTALKEYCKAHVKMDNENSKGVRKGLEVVTFNKNHKIHKSLLQQQTWHYDRLFQDNLFINCIEQRSIIEFRHMFEGYVFQCIGLGVKLAAQ